MRSCLGIAALTCAILPQPAIANDADDGPQLRAAQSVFQQRLGQDQKLQDIGWKLVSGNAEFCANSIPSIGLQLHDMASYGRPDAVRKLLGLEGDIAVLTAAKGSPADKAGLTLHQEITAIDGVDPASWESESRSDWQRSKRMHDWIDQRLAEDGSVTLTLAEDREITLEPVLACASRFELSGDNKRAMAEGSRVILGYHFPGFAYPEEELAAAIAHELAHNVLHHREWLDANGRSRSNVRLTEREADRLMPWLLANAGYDPAAAVRFMARWGPVHDGGIFRKRTHDGWDERVEFIEAEHALIAELQEEDGVDWRRHFGREITTP